MAVVGARGIGKTYACKKYMLDCDGSTILLRRWDADISPSTRLMASFLSDLPDSYRERFCLCGNSIYSTEDVKDTKNGYNPLIASTPKVQPLSLSTGSRHKGVAWSEFVFGLFDEFICKPHERYLPAEWEAFNDMRETIGRMRNFRWLLAANAVSSLNPYFVAWQYTPRHGIRRIGSDTVIEYPNPSEEWMEAKMATPFGQAMRKTDWGKKNLENNFSEDDRAYIVSKPKGAIPLWGIICSTGGRFTCFQADDAFYIGDELKDGLQAFGDTPECNDIGPITNALFSMWLKGKLWFEHLGVKFEVLTLLKVV